MKLFYIIREGWDGLWRAKTAALVATLTLAGTLFLMGFFALVTYNLVRIVEALRDRIELEVFIDQSYDAAKVESLRLEIQQITGIGEVRYVSREEAVEVFRREFGDEFLSVLESNPLPASFRVGLEKDYQNSVEADHIAGKLGSLAGVDEVVYKKDLIQTLDKYFRFIFGLDVIAGVLVCAGSIFVVVNHVRLVASAKKRTIETMQLVGATRAMIRWPFLIQGMVHGLAGAGIVSLAFVAFKRMYLADFQHIIQIPPFFLPALVIFGICLGFFASYFGVRRFVE